MVCICCCCCLCNSNCSLWSFNSSARILASLSLFSLKQSMSSVLGCFHLREVVVVLVLLRFFRCSSSAPTSASPSASQSSSERSVRSHSLYRPPLSWLHRPLRLAPRQWCEPVVCKCSEIYLIPPKSRSGRYNDVWLYWCYIWVSQQWATPGFSPPVTIRIKSFTLLQATRSCITDSYTLGYLVFLISILFGLWFLVGVSVHQCNPVS